LLRVEDLTKWSGSKVYGPTRRLLTHFEKGLIKNEGLVYFIVFV